MMETAIIRVENRTASAGQATASPPGRRMIMAPMKPTATAVQRRARTTSCRKITARMVTKKGAVKTQRDGFGQRHLR